MVHEGKAKIVKESQDAGCLEIYFKDDTTAFNGEKKEQLAGKGLVNAAITAKLFPMFEAAGVPTHFVRQLDERTHLVKNCKIVPIEVVVRNKAAGSFCKRYGVEEGHKFWEPIIELFYKDDSLNDPLVVEQVAIAMGWTYRDQLKQIKRYTKSVNTVLLGYFASIGLDLVDFKLEFGIHSEKKVWKHPGRESHGTIEHLLLADEFSPDSCRLWDMETGEKLDKDRFRFDLGDAMEGYHEIAKRMDVL